MKRIFVGLFLGTFFLASCGDDGEKKESLIDPSDANSLSDAITIQASSRQNGGPPSPSGAGAPVLTPLITSTTSSNGSSTPVILSFNSGSAPTGMYVQVVGANTYFDVPISNPGSITAGQITLPVGLPANLDEGSFELTYSVYGSGLVSNVGDLFVDVKRLGTGALQVSLSWNTATDQDLYVTDPDGETISYQTDFSSSGGALDRDDTDGYGPENIFWLEDAPNGDYSVSVDDYSGTGVLTTCFVTLTAPGKTKTFTVTTQSGSMPLVVSFTKSGSNYDF